MSFVIFFTYFQQLLSPQAQRNSRRGAVANLSAPHSSHGNRQPYQDSGGPKLTGFDDGIPGNDVSLNTDCRINTEDDVTPPPDYSECSADEMPSFPPPGYDVTTGNFDS